VITLDPDTTVAFSQHFGTLLAPSALSVGARTPSAFALTTTASLTTLET
jgi:hypothetical protein